MDLLGALFSRYVFPEAKLYVKDEILINKHDLGSKELIDLIREKEKVWSDTIPMDPSANIVRIADTSNPILLNDWSNKYNFHVGYPRKGNSGSSPSVRAGVSLLRDWLNQGRILIHPRCKNLILTLKQQQWKKSKNRVLDDFRRTKHLGHAELAIALVYTIRHVDEITNPVPSKVHPVFQEQKPMFNVPKRFSALDG